MRIVVCRNVNNDCLYYPPLEKGDLGGFFTKRGKSFVDKL
jgi:hypothetical protein